MIPNPSLFGTPCPVAWCDKWIKEGTLYCFGELDIRLACDSHRKTSKGLEGATLIGPARYPPFKVAASKFAETVAAL